MLHVFSTNLSKVEKIDQHASHNVIYSRTEEVARTPTKASLSGDFMALLPMHSYFRNSEKEFHPHKTLSLHQYGVTSIYLIPLKL
jgi:hypothetical protein